MPILGIGRNTAYELVRSGQIRSIKIGRQIRVPRDAVAEFLTSNGRHNDANDAPKAMNGAALTSKYLKQTIAKAPHSGYHGDMIPAVRREGGYYAARQ